jgi:hypothetical protein
MALIRWSGLLTRSPRAGRAERRPHRRPRRRLEAERLEDRTLL